MGQVADAFNSVYRDFNTDGVAASGHHEPVKSEIRAIGPVIETAVSGGALSIASYATVAAMNADTSKPTGTLAYVFKNNGSTSDPANGFYQWNGTAWEAAAWVMAAVAAAAQPEIDAAIEATTIQHGDNTALGTETLSDITSGLGDTAIGNLAARDLTTGSNNTAVGDSALRANTTGGSNVAIGAAADRVLIGSQNTTVGAEAGLLRTSGDANVAIGYGAQAGVVAGGDRNVAVGFDALADYAGDDATAVGAQALSGATGTLNTAIGSGAGASITTGGRNVLIGAGAGGAVGQLATAINTIVIGQGAVSTKNNQIVLGTNEHGELNVFGVSFARYSSVASNLFLGNAGGGAGHSGTVVLAIGPDANFKGETVSNSVFIGRQAGYWMRNGGGNVAVGDDAMKNADNPTPGVLPVGTVLGSPTDCTAVGREAGRDLQGVVGTTLIGRLAGAKTTTGTGNTGVGDTSLRDNVTGEYNVGLGYAALYRNITGSYNVAVGRTALGGSGSFTRSVGVGDECAENATGDDGTYVGYRAGRSLTTGDGNIMIGSGAGTDVAQKVDAVNSIAIGTGAYTTADNQIVLGNEDHDLIEILGTSFTADEIAALKALLP